MPSPKHSLRTLLFAALATSVCFGSAAFAQDPQSEERPQPPKIIRKSGGVLQGSATRRAEPVYPPLAKAARISGSVVVEVTIDEEGNVISARAVSGHPLLKDAAVAAAREWKFSATQLQGIPVKVIGTITFNFHMDYSKDIEFVNHELDVNPNSPELHYKLAELFRYDRQHEKAIEEYRRALGLRSDYVEAFIGLGEACAIAGRFDEALEACIKGLSANPVPEQAEMLNVLLGRVYLEQGRNQEALEAFKQAVAMKPDSVEAHFQLGLTYLKLGDKQSADYERDILEGLSKDVAEMLRRSIEKAN